MTDNDIIKAYEYCISHDDCDECICVTANICCIVNRPKLALDLIKRQKANIERLNEELNIIRAYIHDNGLEWDLLSYSKRNGR